MSTRRGNESADSNDSIKNTAGKRKEIENNNNNNNNISEQKTNDKKQKRTPSKK